MTKSGWGVGVVVGLGFFILALAIMVVLSLSSPTELVTDRYYERGEAYQDRITTLQRTAAREGKLAAEVLADAIVLTFPRQESVTPLSGSIHLYRPSDKSRDRSVPVAPDTAGIQRIPTVSLERGLWVVKVSWEEEGVGYYAEQQIMIR